MTTIFERVKTALTPEEVVRIQDAVGAVRVEESLLDYVVALAQATREDPRVRLGLSPRGSQALCHAARACAAIEGRDYCIPDDIKRVAVPVVAHPGRPPWAREGRTARKHDMTRTP